MSGKKRDITLPSEMLFLFSSHKMKVYCKNVLPHPHTLNDTSSIPMIVLKWIEFHLLHIFFFEEKVMVTELFLCVENVVGYLTRNVIFHFLVSFSWSILLEIGKVSGHALHLDQRYIRSFLYLQYLEILSWLLEDRFSSSLPSFFFSLIL